MVAKVAAEEEKFASKHHTCKKTGYMKRDFPEKNIGNDVTDVNDLVNQMIEVEGDDIEATILIFLRDTLICLETPTHMTISRHQVHTISMATAIVL